MQLTCQAQTPCYWAYFLMWSADTCKTVCEPFISCFGEYSLHHCRRYWVRIIRWREWKVCRSVWDTSGSNCRIGPHFVASAVAGYTSCFWLWSPRCELWLCRLLSAEPHFTFCKMGIVTVPPHRGGMPIKWENLKKAIYCSINDSVCCGWYCHNDMNMWYFTCLGSKHTIKLTYTTLF